MQNRVTFWSDDPHEHLCCYQYGFIPRGMIIGVMPDLISFSNSTLCFGSSNSDFALFIAVIPLSIVEV